jgi:putative transposon-encoded protein
VLNHWHLTKIYGKKNESVVTPSGNSGHVVVPKAWIGKEAIVRLKVKEKGRKSQRYLLASL